MKKSHSIATLCLPEPAPRTPPLKSKRKPPRHQGVAAPLGTPAEGSSIEGLCPSCSPAEGSSIEGLCPSRSPAEGSSIEGLCPSRSPAEGSSIEGLCPSRSPAEGSAARPGKLPGAGRVLCPLGLRAQGLPPPWPLAMLAAAASPQAQIAARSAQPLAQYRVWPNLRAQL